MTNEQINIAIAEVRGILGPWTKQITPCGCDGQWDLFNPDGVRLPDCCNDLNAMHEVVCALSVASFWDYADILEEIVPSDYGVQSALRANARQQAEAFLRAIKEWKETK